MRPSVVICLLKTSESIQTEFSAVTLSGGGSLFEGMTDVQGRGILELQLGIMNNNNNNNNSVTRHAQ